VVVEGERTVPLSLRERIRAYGPTVDLALNRSRFAEDEKRLVAGASTGGGARGGRAQFG
jgi:hypothetical protein